MDLSEDEIPKPAYDHLGSVLASWRLIAAATAGVALLATLVLGLIYLLTPSRFSASLAFRPTFLGISRNEYPNNLPFSTADLVDASIIDQVYDANHVQDFCSRPAFRAGFGVETYSLGLDFLRLEYQARLSDIRLTSVDRQRLQDEYAQKVLAVVPEYRLTYVQSPECVSLPRQVAIKALDDVLRTWAIDADERRGVLKLRVAVVTPEILVSGMAKSQPFFVRMDALRAALLLALNQLNALKALPGSELIHAGKPPLGFVEVDERIRSLLDRRLEPLLATGGATLGRGSIEWLEQLVSTKTRDAEAAHSRVVAYQAALMQYTGTGSAPQPSAGQTNSSNRGQGDVGSVQTQVDKSFIDSIIAMSEKNIQFRQDLTRQFTQASVAEVAYQSQVAYYQALLATFKRGGPGSGMTEAAIETAIGEIVQEGQKLVAQLDELYAEFSRVSLRASGAMYQSAGLASATTVRSFQRQQLLQLILAFTVVGFVLSTLYVIVAGAMRSRKL